MIRVIYITTSLSDKGPVQQLFNIISSLDKSKFEPVVILLTAPFDGDKTELFTNLGIEIHVCPWKWSYILLPFFSFAGLLKSIKPNVIHSSGFLPDVLCAFSRLKYPWIITIRNDPFIDYPMKFGFLFGHFMAFLQLFVIKLCPSPVACSSALSMIFKKKYRVDTKIVRNGVDIDFFNQQRKNIFQPSNKIRFLTAGSLISRKNIELMVSLFSSKSLYDVAELIVLGDGDLQNQCLKIAKNNIFFKGHVSDVIPYFSESDCYISLSKSEGMPNSVMEALVGGLPCVLSNIEPHKEINSVMPKATFLIDINSNFKELEESLKTFVMNSKTREDNFNQISVDASKVFDSKINSREYQKIYLQEQL